MPYGINLENRGLCAVDPGLHNSGIAFFEDNELKFAELTTTFDVLSSVMKARPVTVGWLVMEGQQIYAKFAADPADIINLARESGKLIERIPHHHHTVILPRQWKGTVKKEIMTERIIKRLSPAEHAVINLPKRRTLAHNVYDAIGIGLHILGRL